MSNLDKFSLKYDELGPFFHPKKRFYEPHNTFFLLLWCENLPKKKHWMETLHNHFNCFFKTYFIVLVKFSNTKMLVLGSFHSLLSFIQLKECPFASTYVSPSNLSSIYVFLNFTCGTFIIQRCNFIDTIKAMNFLKQISLFFHNFF